MHTEKTTEMESLVENFKSEYVKFSEKDLQEIRNLAKELRDQISRDKKEAMAN